MKPILLATAVLLIFGASGLTAPPPSEPAEISSSCNPCVAGEDVIFTATGVTAIGGAKEHYYACVTGWSCLLLPKSVYPVVDNTMTFPLNFSPGEYAICLVLDHWNKPDEEIACTSITVG